MKNFIGRGEYLAKLNDLWRKRTSSMVVVSGRRRIGKSTLVEEFAERSGCRFIEIVGLAPDDAMTNQRQIDNFCERLARATGSPEAKADCWAKAFDALDASLKGNARTIVFLDEISWMGRYDDGFAAFLKTAWDTQFSRHDRLILVLAGSVSAWIRHNIQRAKGFVGRLSLDFTLPEISLDECREFWGRKADRTMTRDLLDTLSVTGGVPKYLNEIDPSLSADDNIKRLCFDRDGYLFKDFDRIFDDVFEETRASKKRILTALADGPASVSELAERFGIDPNGHISEDLSELEEAGFVAGAAGKNPQTGKTVREVRYRLRDNYTRFYLKYILPKREAIETGMYRYVSLDRLSGWDTMMGFQFENLVLNNFPVLASRIGLFGKCIDSAAPYFRRGGRKTEGVQVDLLVQLPKSVYVIEIKRKARISGVIENEVAEKVRKLKLPAGKSVRHVLVYDGELAPEVEENGYFDYLISAEELLLQIGGNR